MVFLFLLLKIFRNQAVICSETGDHGGFLAYLWNSLAFVLVFVLLLLLGILKAILIGPIVWLAIALGNTVVIVGLWPYHAFWTYYCIAKTKKFGTLLKSLLLLSLPIPLLLWPLMGVIGSIFAGLGFGLISPLMATFEAVGEGVSNKFMRCFRDGTWSSIFVGCTIVRDFADVCFYSYFSLMDGLLNTKNEMPTEIKLFQIPGCIITGVIGVLIDVPIITLLVIYKAPVMLFKGWRRLVQDLIGRAGPFLETVCLPFAGLSILLWPIVVGLSTLVGIVSSFFLGCYAAAVAYQENSMKRGLLYVISIISMFDEYTNDFLYLREGSCLPRPSYRKAVGSAPPRLPLKHLSEPSDTAKVKQPPIRTPSEKMQALKAMLIWNNFFEACEYIGKELIGDGAIEISDLEAWKILKNNIINIGLPAYAFLQCFLRSIKSGSSGFLMSDNVELTNVNRPEGRVFDWLFEPMSIMKEQLRVANLPETEELYLCKLALYCGDAKRLETWENGGVPPDDEVRRAQLEGISRRLQGFSLTLSRLPTFRRRFHEVVKAVLQEGRQRSKENNETNGIEDV